MMYFKMLVYVEVFETFINTKENCLMSLILLYLISIYLEPPMCLW